MDVANAFLHGDLLEDVYTKMPPGYNHLECRITPTSTYHSGKTSLVCKLKKSIYGLKQSPRNWFSKLTSTLLQHDFLQSKADYSLFTKAVQETIIVCLIYVDDLLICGNSIIQIQNLKAMLASNFNMKDLGALRYFMGIEIDQTSSGIFMSQEKYTQDLLKEYGMLDAKHIYWSASSRCFKVPKNGR